MKRKKKKKINRKSLYISLVLIVVFIVSLSVVYAALSETLTISGNTEVQAANWDIRFTEGWASVTGTATYTEPIIDGTILRDYTVSLKKPGDAVVFSYYIFNSGDFSAKITSLINSTPVCTSSTGNKEDENAVCDNLNIKFYITSESEIFDIIGTGLAMNAYYASPVSPICPQNSTITPDRAYINLEISLNNAMDTVVGSDVTISNLKNELILTASDEECDAQLTCFVAGTKVLTSSGYKNIEDIKIGDYVYSINKYGQRELKRVYYKYNKKARKLQSIQVGREIIEVTPEHRIYVIGKGYVRADAIQKGDRLYGVRDGFVVSNNTLNYKEEIPVYNMSVQDNHNYLVTELEFLVHNDY